MSRICPDCKRPNDTEALVCVYCGAPLDADRIDPTTERMQNVSFPLSGQGVPEDDQQINRVIPPDAIAIYLVGETKPFVISEKGEFILGRHVVEGIDNIIDLTPCGGFEKGVSRKHAVIRKTDVGYEIVDLFSTNGTWLNEKRLLPNKPYILDSGIHIRLGQLQLVTIFGRTNEP